MPLISVAPSRLPDGQANGFAFETGEMNQMVRAEYLDTFGFYQNLFGVYSYMRMNRKQKYILHQPKGTKLVWQPYTSCSYDSTGTLQMGRRELIPEFIAMNEKWCQDELLDSTYEHWMEAVANGDLILTDEGVAAFNLMMEELMANSVEGLRATLSAGRLYNVNTVNYSEDNTTTITDMFKKTHGSARGWVKLAYDLAKEKYDHLNVASFDDSDFEGEGDYTGDIVKLLENLKKAAPKPLRQLINHGGMIRGGGRSFMPLIGLSDSFFNAVVRYWNAESEKTATNRTRITRERIAAENSPTPQFVYYLDGILPIVPLQDVSAYDEYLKGRTHFAGIFGSGNIQMGHQFGVIPEVERDQIGLMVAKVTDPSRDNYGQYVVKSHAAVKAAIADPNYMVSTIGYTE